MTAFSVGEQVRVRQGDPPGHIRTPFYARGKTGVVERICGRFRNPEELAYGAHERARKDALSGTLRSAGIVAGLSGATRRYGRYRNIRTLARTGVSNLCLKE